MEDNAQTTEYTVDLNSDYVRSPVGILRIAIAVASLCGIISSSADSYWCYDDGRVTFYLIVASVTFIQATVIIIFMLMRLDTKFGFTKLPISLFVNDSVFLFFHFVASICIMLSIGFCYHSVTGKIFASLFSLTTFLATVGLVYINYSWWRDSITTTITNGAQNQGSTSTTVTETSPTVLA